ncbi:hypothetical protein LSTR_LSTR010135 [Laodelphax striatellus]|uniref:Uncharacterized protein n=1 Tax=Laodelphax striatellus TaxID=195883 RepID=A0A482WIW7_LAOST|nr:hypothetical protein LSTR_LSTR010135 [Laodelphax striatellus]
MVILREVVAGPIRMGLGFLQRCQLVHEQRYGEVVVPCSGDSSGSCLSRCCWTLELERSGLFCSSTDLLKGLQVDSLLSLSWRAAAAACNPLICIPQILCSLSYHTLLTV